MKITILVLFGSLALSTRGMAQRLSPSVLAAGGGSARTATMSLDWTVGEAVVGTERTAGQLYSQGFHQPLLQVSEQQNLTSLDVEYWFTIAPNPVVAFLTLGITAPENSPLQLLLTDMNGRQYSLPIVPASTTSTQVDMTAFPAGTYLLRIGKTDGSQLKVYKILKTQ